MPEPDSRLSNGDEQRLSELCKEFESSEIDAATDSISALLARTESDLRARLLKTLIGVDLRRRLQQGLAANPSRYGEFGDAAVGAAFLILKEIEQDRTLIGDQTLVGSIYQLPTMDGEPNTDDSKSVGEKTEQESTASRSAPVIGESTLIGKYRLLHLIGEGGMGAVWAAQQEKPVRRKVALKLIRSDIGSRKAIARFEAERQTLAIMDHPNIAKVFDAGTTIHGSPYFVMELVDGIPITKYCDANQLSIKDRIKLFVPVCKAVQHAHQKGIVHRDLKPSNVLVTKYDGQPEPKVIDFGLAKVLDNSDELSEHADRTSVGQVVGTLRYMSPEQAGIDDQDIDTRTDVYSLGVVLYELVTGSTPLDESSFQRGALLDVIKEIKELEPIKPSSRLSNSNELELVGNQRNIDPQQLKRILQGDLDWVVMKALEKDRVMRYETVAGMAEDLERFLDDDTVLARPPSTTYRLRKFVKRNKGLVASLTSLLILLITGAIISAVFAIEANRAKIAFADKAESEAIQRDIAERKTIEARSNEQAAIRAKRLAEEQTQIATAATNKLAIQLRQAELGEYSAELRQIRSANESGAYSLAMNMLERVGEMHRGWEYRYLENQMRQRIRYRNSTAESDTALETISINSAFDTNHFYYVLGGLRRVDLETGTENEILDLPAGDIYAISISADDKWIALTSLKQIDVYSLKSLKKVFSESRDYSWVISAIESQLAKNDLLSQQTSYLKVAGLCPRMLDESHLIASRADGIDIIDINNQSKLAFELDSKNGLSGFEVIDEKREILVWHDNMLKAIDSKGNLIHSFHSNAYIRGVTLDNANSSILVTTDQGITELSNNVLEAIAEIPVRGISNIHVGNSSGQFLYLIGKTHGVVHLWDRRTSSLIAEKQLRATSDGILAFDLTKDGKFCVFNDSQSWFLLNLEDSPPSHIQIENLVFAAHVDQANLVCVQVENKKSRISIFNPIDARLRPLKTVNGDVVEAAYDPITKQLAVIVRGVKNELQLYNIDNGDFLRPPQTVALGSKLSSSGQLLLTSNSRNNSFDLVETINGKKLGEIPKFDFDELVAPFDSEAWLNGTVDTGLDLFDEFEFLDHYPDSIEVSPNRRFVYCAYSQQKEFDIRWQKDILVGYDLEGGNEVFRFVSKLGQRRKLLIDQDGQRLFVAAPDGSLSIRDPLSGIELLTFPTSFPELSNFSIDIESDNILWASQVGINWLRTGKSPIANSNWISVDPNVSVSSIDRQKPFLNFAELDFHRVPFDTVIDSLNERTGIKLMVPQPFLKTVSNKKYRFKGDCLDDVLMRLTRRTSWSYIYIHDEAKYLAMIVPNNIVETIPNRHLTRREAEKIEELDEWFAVSAD